MGLATITLLTKFHQYSSLLKDVTKLSLLFYYLINSLRIDFADFSLVRVMLFKTYISSLSFSYSL